MTGACLVAGGMLWELVDSVVGKVVAAVAAPVIALVAYGLGRQVYRAYQALKLSRAALAAVARRENGGQWTEGPGFWLKQPIVWPEGYQDKLRASIPILLIANLKGGVGKTTLAANLAGHFAKRWRKANEETLRVLLIDLDFQGSLSTMTVSDERRFMQPSKANKLISGDLARGAVIGEAEPLSRERMVPAPKLSTIPAYYDLAQAENRTQIEWLLPLSDEDFLKKVLQWLRLHKGSRARRHRDVRFLLAETLLHPRTQQSYDLVIIDAPPRLSTSHVQALCAAKYVLIPTILDGLSSDAVGRYLEQIATHKLGPPDAPGVLLCPVIEPIGVVCNLRPANVNLAGRIGELKERLAPARLQTDILPEDCFIRVRSQFRDEAGDRIAYLADTKFQPYRELREEIDRLGSTVADRMGMTAGPGRWSYVDEAF